MSKKCAAAGCTSALTSLCVTGPIWLVLLYKVLVATNADQMAWALYWIYVPAYVAATVLENFFVGMIDHD